MYGHLVEMTFLACILYTQSHADQMGLINEYELVNTTKALGNHESSLAEPLHPVFPLQL